jgi:hypothetical protein
VKREIFGTKKCVFNLSFSLNATSDLMELAWVFGLSPPKLLQSIILLLQLFIHFLQIIMHLGSKINGARINDRLYQLRFAML